MNIVWALAQPLRGKPSLHDRKIRHFYDLIHTWRVYIYIYLLYKRTPHLYRLVYGSVHRVHSNVLILINKKNTLIWYQRAVSSLCFSGPEEIKYYYFHSGEAPRKEENGRGLRECAANCRYAKTFFYHLYIFSLVKKDKKYLFKGFLRFLNFFPACCSVLQVLPNFSLPRLKS